MFFSNEHYHSHNVRVREYRAPTDESVRLLKELQEEAEKSVIERGMLKCQNTNIEIAYMLQNKPFGQEIKYQIMINNKKYTNSVTCCANETVEDAITKDIPKFIAKHLIPVFKRR